MRLHRSLLPLAAALALGGCSQERTCPTDETACGGTCVALATDAGNCGACGNTCAQGEACHAGACTTCAAACGQGQVCQDGMCVAAVYAACGNLAEVRGMTADLAPAGPTLPTDQGPNSMVVLDGTLYVENSLSGTLSVVTFDPTASTPKSLAIVPNATTGGADLEYVAAHDGLIFVSNSMAGTLVAYDPVRRLVIDETPLGAAGEPVYNQGFTFVGEKAYVALNGVNAVAVVDVSAVPTCQPSSTGTSCGKLLERIDLSKLAYATASAGPTRAVAYGTNAFVSLNDEFDATYAPVQGANGRLAVIDTVTGTAAPAALDLGNACQDASGLALDGTTLWVACGYYDYFGTKAVSGAALVPVDLSGSTPVVGAAIPLPNAASSVAFCGGVAYAGATDSGTVMRIDTAARTVTAALICAPPVAGADSYVPSVACAP